MCLECMYDDLHSLVASKEKRKKKKERKLMDAKPVLAD